MNLLAFGHAGLERRRASQSFVAGLLETIERTTGPFANKPADEIVAHVVLEDELDLDIVAFLDLDDRRDQQRLWNEAAERAIQKLKAKRDAVYRVLTLHATYYRQSQIWTCLDPLIFREMQFLPDAALTFIDDVHNVQSRLEFRPGSLDWLRLRELVTWRNIEISDADLFLRALSGRDSRPKNFVLGIRHPVKTAVQLLVDRSRPTVYAGHPISHIRRQDEAVQAVMIKEIEEEFKAPLRRLAAVLDPATIDELALLRLKKEGSPSIQFAQELHWPVAREGALVSPEFFPASVEVSSEEVEEATLDVNRLVHFRDYRLMDQSDCVISYRPNWGGATHAGVEAEFRFAKAAGMPRLAWVSSEDKELGQVFAYVTARASSLAEVEEFLRTRVKVGRRFKTISG